MLLAFNLEEYFSKDDMLGKVLELLIFSAMAFVLSF